MNLKPAVRRAFIIAFIIRVRCERRLAQMCSRDIETKKERRETLLRSGVFLTYTLHMYVLWGRVRISCSP